MAVNAPSGVSKSINMEFGSEKWAAFSSKVLHLRLGHLTEHLESVGIGIGLLLLLELRENHDSLAGACRVLIQGRLIASSNVRVLVEVVLELAFQVGVFDLSNSLENVWLVASSASVLPLHESLGVRGVAHDLGRDIVAKCLHLFKNNYKLSLCECLYSEIINQMIFWFFQI